MNIQIHLYVVKGKGVEWRVTNREEGTISMVVVDKVTDECYYFEAPAHHLQAWCAKRNLGYEHQVLNIPVTLE